jgi:WD40 repeat protein
MTSLRAYCCCGAAIAAALMADTIANPARSAPAGQPPFRPGGLVKVADLSVEAAAALDDSAVVVVGSRLGPEEAQPIGLPANGALIDLTKKTILPFTNGHTFCINSVAAGRGGIVTAGTSKEPFVRVWDRKAGKTVAATEIEKPDGLAYYAVGCFNRSNKVAVAAGRRVLIFDPARPDDRAELACPLDLPAGLSNPILIDPADSQLACSTAKTDVVLWQLATATTKVYSALPRSADPEDNTWLIGSVRFGAGGSLFASRWRSEDEVAEKTAEADVSADRRGVIRIDLNSGRVEPLGLGQTISTLSCAVDPSGIWLATAGSSRPDRPRPDGQVVVGELRVYHLPSRALTYREQVDGLPLIWVDFTPGGKRLVSASRDGVIRWWELSGR